MNITFTQQEKELFLQKQGFITDIVIGFIDTDLGCKDFPVKIAYISTRETGAIHDYIQKQISELTGKYYANIQTEYGIDVVFEREFKRKLLSIL